MGSGEGSSACFRPPSTPCRRRRTSPSTRRTCRSICRCCCFQRPFEAVEATTLVLVEARAVIVKCCPHIVIVAVEASWLVERKGCMYALLLHFLVVILCAHTRGSVMLYGLPFRGYAYRTSTYVTVLRPVLC